MGLDRNNEFCSDHASAKMLSKYPLINAGFLTGTVTGFLRFFEFYIPELEKFPRYTKCLDQALLIHLVLSRRMVSFMSDGFCSLQIESIHNDCVNHVGILVKLFPETAWLMQSENNLLGSCH